MSPALLGRTFCTRTSQEENKKQREIKNKQDKGNCISFCNFSSHPTQGWTPLPIPSKSSLPQPCFSSLSQFFMPVTSVGLEISLLSLLLITLSLAALQTPNCPIPPSNSLQCHLPSTSIFQSCPCFSPAPSASPDLPVQCLTHLQ